MSENGFPNSKFEFMEEIWNENLMKIKSVFRKFFRKGILKQKLTKVATRQVKTHTRVGTRHPEPRTLSIFLLVTFTPRKISWRASSILALLDSSSTRKRSC
jgi:hypothetical protein